MLKLLPFKGFAEDAYSENFSRYQNSLKSAVTPATKIRIATMNFGFLNLAELVKVPKYRMRLQYLPGELGNYLTEQSPDVLLLQEIWHEDVSNVVRETAGKCGYTSVNETFSSDFYTTFFEYHGLEILVRDDLNLSGSGFLHYRDNDGNEIRSGMEKALGLFEYRRGVLFLGFVKNNRSFVVFNTHLTPLANFSETRNQQLESLKRITEEFHSDYVLLGGDFNFSSEHAFAEDSNLHKEWASDRETYLHFVKSTEYIDSYKIANPKDSGFTYSRRNNPLTGFGKWNHDKKPEERLDYIWFKTNSGSCEVLDSKLVFDQPITDPMGKVIFYDEKNLHQLFISDHYGVQSDLLCE